VSCDLILTHKPDQDGYIRLRTRHGKRYAHDLAWEEYHGMSIPSGYVVHHLCHNKACKNPIHLELLLQGEHTRLHNAREICKRGHSMTPENVYYCTTKTTGKKQRLCRPCSLMRQSHAK